MPMTELTVSERIFEELHSRLSKLVDNLEQTSVSEIIRPTRLGTFTPKDLQIVVVQANPELVPELMCPGNPPAEAWRQVFNLYLHIMPSESDEEVIDSIRSRFIADVRRVVCTPSATWHNFGGWAIDAEWLSMENIESGESCGGVLVPIAITYRTDEGDPYQVRA